LILLSLGTHRQPLNRALDLIEPLARDGTHFIVQYGSTAPRPEMPGTTWVELMAFDELVETMARAESVVCHAGVGTIMTALQAGHTPVVIPRQAQHGEHVDDHQLDIATHFAERGLVRCVTSETDLVPLLTARGENSSPRVGKGSVELRAVVAAAADAEPRRRLRSR
jgi:UDP-N-acetylglucosamine transferase subunit ALG13